MPLATFNHTIPVQADAARLWALVHDVRRVAELFTFTKLEEFTELEPDCWAYWRELTIPSIAALRWREQARVTGEHELSFHVIEGELEQFDGCWRVTPDSAASKLTLELTYAIPDGVGPSVPDALAHYVINEIFKTICQRLKQVAEEVAA